MSLGQISRKTVNPYYKAVEYDWNDVIVLS